jgi:hypothetical protein
MDHTSKKQLQVAAWSNDNGPVPEQDINAIVQSAVDMQTAPGLGYTDKNYYVNAKPYDIWIPHRENELENALAIASTFAMNQAQNQIFNNVKTMLVFMVSEPRHVMTASNDPPIWDKELNDSHSWVSSAYGSDGEMDQKVKQEWNKFNSYMDELLKVERYKKEKKQYDSLPDMVVPYHVFHQEHVTMIYQSVGMAMASAVSKCRELGYYSQFHTTYRRSVAWHDFYGNKFHPEKKWYPTAILLIGTQPSVGKISASRNSRDKIDSDTSFVTGNPPVNDSLVAIKTFEGIPILDPRRKEKDDGKGKKRSIDHLQGTVIIPDSHMKFFWEQYGKHSSDPRKLFSMCYSTRLSSCDSQFDGWLKKNMLDG